MIPPDTTYFLSLKDKHVLILIDKDYYYLTRREENQAYRKEQIE